jgi:hypothetical protein
LNWASGGRLGTIDEETIALGALLPGLGLAAFGLGGEVGGTGSGRRAGGEGGRALLPLETVDLILEALVLLPQGAVLGDELLDEVEEGADGLTRGLVRDATEVQVQVEVCHESDAAEERADQQGKESRVAPPH